MPILLFYLILPVSIFTSWLIYDILLNGVLVITSLTWSYFFSSKGKLVHLSQLPFYFIHNNDSCLYILEIL